MVANNTIHPKEATIMSAAPPWPTDAKARRAGFCRIDRASTRSMAYNRALITAIRIPAMRPTSFFLLAILALVMVATRIHHFAAIPDASWAVFFVAGFYFGKQGRWVFPALIVLAFLADWYAIAGAGLDFWSHYCVSPAYWFLLPAYFSLWLGGWWLQRHGAGLRWGALASLAAALLVSVSLCYLLSNGSYYWLSDGWGGADAQRSLAGWFTNLGHWYLPFLKVTAMYVAVAAGLHAAALAAGFTPAIAGERGSAA